ncbi:MAG: nucleotidyltransferase domain-containing protein [Gammaproteobacteria bacterium]|nr:nucleotidyltransferase domain-containing protein [Gammaproteobacteria bacterium]
MRLTTHAQKIIRDTVREVFGREACVTLFGSRIDDAARGGDIDLLIQSEIPIEQRERKALQLVARLQIRLGDQPIDVLVLDPETERQPVHEEAIRTGISL